MPVLLLEGFDHSNVVEDYELAQIVDLATEHSEGAAVGALCSGQQSLQEDVLQALSCVMP